MNLYYLNFLTDPIDEARLSMFDKLSEAASSFKNKIEDQTPKVNPSPNSSANNEVEGILGCLRVCDIYI